MKELSRIRLSRGAQKMREPFALLRSHFRCTLDAQCECVKPMLYRVSLEKEEIKFCTAASDKVSSHVPAFLSQLRACSW